MKKLILFITVLLLLAGAVATWLFIGPATAFNDKKRALYIRTDAATKGAVLDSLTKGIISNTTAFEWLASRMDLWSHLKPGKYDINRGSSLLNIVRKLRNGQQASVNLVITKLRTKEDLARLVGRRFECDSASMMGFLNSSDSLQPFNTEPELAMTQVLPDTYTFFWNTTPQKIYSKLSGEAKTFWTTDRVQKAEALGLTFSKAYILASIVEEETNNTEEKDTIASVYLNRVAKGMPLQADPTIKFGLRDFGLKRIYEKHWRVPTPYNTYLNKGLPPGPICTPSKQTIDAVLSAPQTAYFYFVANKAFNGTHVFTTNYTDHLRYAKEYQKALDTLISNRKAKNETL
ncbi:MAG TPA: endolytic transglycosylase MltG [Chitinophagaceae bacterium]|nr:endolytic transglycosylase MltG [Chitinophagaceae bacterium]